MKTTETNVIDQAGFIHLIQKLHYNHYISIQIFRERERFVIKILQFF